LNLRSPTIPDEYPRGCQAHTFATISLRSITIRAPRRSPLYRPPSRRRNPNSHNLDRPIARQHVALCYCKPGAHQISQHPAAEDMAMNESLPRRRQTSCWPAALAHGVARRPGWPPSHDGPAELTGGPRNESAIACHTKNVGAGTPAITLGGFPDGPVFSRLAQGKKPTDWNRSPMAGIPPHMDKGSCRPRWQINVSVANARGINLPHRVVRSPGSWNTSPGSRVSPRLIRSNPARTQILHRNPPIRFC
jgi:hypothetical protein